MPNPEGEIWRAILNWIIPFALAGSIIQAATKMLTRKRTFTGILLSFVVSMLLSVMVGTLAFMYFEEVFKAASVTSFIAITSNQLSTYLVEQLKIDKGLNVIFSSIFNAIAKKINKILE